MSLVAENAGAAVHHCDWRELASEVERQGGCDAMIFDAPYSSRTHSGHNTGSVSANKLTYAAENSDTAIGRYAAKDRRRLINYESWDRDDVAGLVDAFGPLVRGWWVSLTDHVLAGVWAEEFERAGLYTFSPLACVEPGGRVRISGDGPAQWSCWAVVARPRNAAFCKWGALPGAYVLPPGQRGEWRGAYGGDRVVGGKPQWLMERLIEHYSKPGDLVCDPTCGAGTTLRAAQCTGRRAIGCDVLEEHAKIAAKRISQPVPTLLFAPPTVRWAEQAGLFKEPKETP